MRLPVQKILKYSLCKVLLLVRYMLYLSCDDFPSFLKDFLIRPFFVNGAEVLSNSVMLAHEYRVKTRKTRMNIGACISYKKIKKQTIDVRWM